MAKNIVLKILVCKNSKTVLKILNIFWKIINLSLFKNQNFIGNLGYLPLTFQDFNTSEDSCKMLQHIPDFRMNELQSLFGSINWTKFVFQDSEKDIFTFENL